MKKADFFVWKEYRFFKNFTRTTIVSKDIVVKPRIFRAWPKTSNLKKPLALTEGIK